MTVQSFQKEHSESPNVTFLHGHRRKDNLVKSANWLSTLKLWKTYIPLESVFRRLFFFNLWVINISILKCTSKKGAFTVAKYVSTYAFIYYHQPAIF